MLLIVLLFLLAPGAPVSFEHTVIDAAPPKNPYMKAVADLNGDGAQDIVAGGAKGPLVWYAAPRWTRHTIAPGGYESVDAEAADIDNDGDLDLVVGGVFWYENPQPRARPDAGEWPAHRIGAHRTHDVEAADMNGDGKIDVVVRGQTGFKHNEGHRILVYRQFSPRTWQPDEIRCPEGEGLEVADMDGDRDPDIVIGGRWYENTGSGWVERVYTRAWTHGDAKVAVADLNGDRRPDVILSPAEYQGGTYRLSWYEAPRNPRDGNWEERTVEQRIETVVHALGAGDFNGDGALDIAAAQMHQGAAPQEVLVYLNRGRGLAWTRDVLSAKGSHNIVVADVDGDGAPDILGANHAGAHQPLELWRPKAASAGAAFD
jgi:hypothetical protein